MFWISAVCLAAAVRMRTSRPILREEVMTTGQQQQRPTQVSAQADDEEQPGGRVKNCCRNSPITN